MQQQLIRDLCKQLRLGSHIAEAYTEIQAKTHEEFLLNVLTEAVRDRELQRRNRYIRQAGFDLMKSFEDFDFSNVTLPANTTAETLRSCNFVRNKQNLILYGRPGTGAYFGDSHMCPKHALCKGFWHISLTIGELNPAK
jgi:DNA replication protein DnaC